MNLGENIYRLRTSRKMSQDSLAEALEVSRQSVSKWENNMAVPDLERLIKMSRIFGVTLDELVADAPPEPPPEDASEEEPEAEPEPEPQHSVWSQLPGWVKRYRKLWLLWGIYLILAYLLLRPCIRYELWLPCLAAQCMMTLYTVLTFLPVPLKPSRWRKHLMILGGIMVYFYLIKLFSFRYWTLQNLMDLYEEVYLTIMIFHGLVTALTATGLRLWKFR